MKYRVIYQVLQMLYSNILRGLLVKGIEDEDSTMDEFILGLVDSLMGYEREE